MADDEPEGKQDEALPISVPVTGEDLFASFLRGLQGQGQPGFDRELQTIFLTEAAKGQHINVLVATYPDPEEAAFLSVLAEAAHPLVARMAKARLVARSDMGNIPRSFAKALERPAPPRAPTSGNVLSKLGLGGSS